ncbi:MAG: Ig-like domain-containing protein [Methanobrevibacter sp.]|jgi:hypothetical protein|nr:Ig-like domain-containing protein [Candidatus Methanovirga procula]
MGCFEYWGRNGYALLGTGRNVTSISTGAKLGDSILFCESPSTNSNYTIYSVTNNSNFGYRNETSFSNSWVNVLFPSMLTYFNASTMNSTDWTIYMTFFEGYVFDVPGNGTGTLVKTYLNVTARDVTLGDTVNITATLKEGDGTPIGNKIIIFSIDGAEYTAVTDDYGIATIDFIPTHLGTIDVTALFNGDDNYLNSTASTIFNVVSGDGTGTGDGTGDILNDVTNGLNDKLNVIENSLPVTGIPLIVLFLGIVSGFYFYKKK